MNGPWTDYPFVQRVPEGDNRPRMVCADCGFIHYENPQVVVGSVCRYEDRVLLCRRAIEPRRGYWTLPAGYLERGESSEAGARREAHEEARAELEIEGLLGVYSIPRISQVQLIYLARLRSPDVAPGEESLETGLFSLDGVPWGELAFPSVAWSLRRFEEVRDLSSFPTFRHTHAER